METLKSKNEIKDLLNQEVVTNLEKDFIEEELISNKQKETSFDMKIIQICYDFFRCHKFKKAQDILDNNFYLLKESKTIEDLYKVIKLYLREINVLDFEIGNLTKLNKLENVRASIVLNEQLAIPLIVKSMIESYYQNMIYKLTNLEKEDILSGINSNLSKEEIFKMIDDDFSIVSHENGIYEVAKDSCLKTLNLALENKNFIDLDNKVIKLNK